MSRSVRIGDYAYITVGDQVFHLAITDIQPSNIIAGNYNLVLVGGRWMVQDYPVKHSISFGPDPSLIAYIPEITSQVLLSLNYDTIMNICKTNRGFNRVCQDDHFWKLKVEHDYDLATQYKPSNITYRQEYIDLVTIKDPNSAAKMGMLYILEWFALHGRYPDLDQDAINDIVKRGYLDVVRWLAAQKNQEIKYTGKYENMVFRIFVDSPETERKARIDIRFKSLGRICGISRRSDLIDIMWHIDAPAPTGNFLDETEENREHFVGYVSHLSDKRMVAELMVWPLDRLYYYYKWSLADRAMICDHIRNYMTKTGRMQ
jgi:hypothetical protein